MIETASEPHCHRSTRAELLQTFDGDEQFVDELAAMFTERCGLLLEEIRSGFRAGDIGAIKRGAHSLKGSIGYFEEGAAYAAAQRLARLTGDELSQVPPLLGSVESGIESLITYIHEEFAREA